MYMYVCVDVYVCMVTQWRTLLANSHTCSCVNVCVWEKDYNLHVHVHTCMCSTCSVYMYVCTYITDIYTVFPLSCCSLHKNILLRHTCTCTCTHTHTHTYTHTHTHTHTHTYTHTHTHTHTHVHTHTHSHTHTQLPHKVGMGIWYPASDQQRRQTTDCIIGLSKQEFAAVINGLSAIIVELIEVNTSYIVVIIHVLIHVYLAYVQLHNYKQGQPS